MLDLAAGEKARVFQGGNYADLHKMLGVRAGSEVLYCGDHVYADILRSKKSPGWRTMLVRCCVLRAAEGGSVLMLRRRGRGAWGVVEAEGGAERCPASTRVQRSSPLTHKYLLLNQQITTFKFKRFKFKKVVPELERELEVAARGVSTQRALEALRAARDELSDRAERLEWALAHGGGGGGGSSSGFANSSSSNGGGGATTSASSSSTAANGNGSGTANGSSNSSSSSANGSSANGSSANGSSGGGAAAAGGESLAAQLAELQRRRDDLKQRHGALLRGYHEAFHVSGDDEGLVMVVMMMMVVMG